MNNKYSTFPILNSSGNIVGLIPKSFIIVLLENHQFLKLDAFDNYQKQRIAKIFSKSISDVHGSSELLGESQRTGSKTEEFEEKVRTKIDTMVTEEL